LLFLVFCQKQKLDMISEVNYFSLLGVADNFEVLCEQLRLKIGPGK
jgi:hypothetical protein